MDKEIDPRLKRAIELMWEGVQEARQQATFSSGVFVSWADVLAEPDDEE